jgi:hypothetical protein
MGGAKERAIRRGIYKIGARIEEHRRLCNGRLLSRPIFQPVLQSKVPAGVATALC